MIRSWNYHQNSLMKTSSKIDLSMMHIIKFLPTLKAISASCDQFWWIWVCFKALNILHLVVLVWSSYNLSIILNLCSRFLSYERVTQVLTYQPINFSPFSDSQTIKLVFYRSSLSHYCLLPFYCRDLIRSFHQTFWDSIDDFTFFA